MKTVHSLQSTVHRRSTRVVTIICFGSVVFRLIYSTMRKTMSQRGLRRILVKSNAVSARRRCLKSSHLTVQVFKGVSQRGLRRMLVKSNTVSARPRCLKSSWLNHISDTVSILKHETETLAASGSRSKRIFL